MHQFNPQDHIPQLSIDCVIFGYTDKQLKVLVCKLKLGKDFFTLPGGFIKKQESIDQAAQRILEERTGLKDIYLEQFRVFGHTERVNDAMPFVLEYLVAAKEFETFQPEALEWLGGRFVSIGYYALVDINKVIPQKNGFDDSIDWVDLEKLPSMIIDHNTITEVAQETLKMHLDEKLIGFNLLPDTFTMKDLQLLYEAVYKRPFARNNFQKKMLDLDVLERLEKKFTGAANKAPYLYRFKK